jgi:NAD(P)-dependent dehydrogenase (short-subunit alcohol dehydrogenase family)
MLTRRKTKRVVVVTGASAGVGRATAVAFARTGDRVGLIARGQDGLCGARRDVEAAGGEARVVPADVADPEDVEQAAADIEARFGPIDIWVNNAMAAVFSPFQQMTAAEYRRVTEVTYLGYVWGTMAALRRMLPRDRGVVVQVGSALAYRAIPLQAAYCGAKHAIEGFTESVRCELLHEGSNVRLTLVQLPAVNTPQFEWGRNRLAMKPQPVPPIFQPEVAADAIMWAAQHPVRERYVAGSTLLAILAERVAPGGADAYLASTGFEAQQSDEPADPDALDNLFLPVPGDRGAHGRFDEVAKRTSLQLWISKRRRELVALGLLGLGAGVARRRWSS